jgi:hypothetical protein
MTFYGNWGLNDMGTGDFCGGGVGCGVFIRNFYKVTGR